MTEEIQREPVLHEPIERRILNGIAALCGVIFWWVMLAQWIDSIPSPEETWDRFKAWRLERRRYREGMRKTFEDIDHLPETEDA